MEQLRIAVLVDLPRDHAAGGHVKYWERIAQAAVESEPAVDLTIYFSGSKTEEQLSPHTRYRYLPPVFSTEKLKFLPYVPAHTDLAPFHQKLAEEIVNYDVIHTTEGCFAFSRTAESIAKWSRIPLVTSFHTDTPAYAEVFTRQTVEHIFGKKFGAWLDKIFKLSARERASKTKRLKTHLRQCSAILAMREEDILLTLSVTTKDKIKPMRLGVDKDLFTPYKHDRAGIEKEYGVAPGKLVILFVGRVDAGKNIDRLTDACVMALRRGLNIHLIVAGLGPLSEQVKAKLESNVTLAGMLGPQELARLYASVDCLAIASDIEIGGMIGLEAVACGCPVLVSRQSGMFQACGKPHSMLMIESSVEAWAQALVDFSHDTEKQKQMREAALICRESHVAGWNEVLNQDFIPVWQTVAKKKDI
jgi:glycosyltransferase involved in cell wall biosynthesis